MIFEKSFNTIEEETNKKLEKAGFSTTPGSIAKLFASIINSNISDFFVILAYKYKNSFISTASDKFVDAIGVLLNCQRRDNESDEDYKYRICSQILTIASSNETAIRLSALAVEGVADVYIKKYSHGAGTFTCVVLSDNTVDSNILLANVESAINKSKACGTKSYVMLPENQLVTMTIKLNFKIALNEIESDDIKEIVKEQVTQYINSIGLGGTLVIDTLTKTIMNCNDYILSYEIINFNIDGELVQAINQQSSWYSRFLVSPTSTAITIK